MNGYQFDRTENPDGRLEYRFSTQVGITYLVEFKPIGYVFEEAAVWTDSCYDFSIRVQDGSRQHLPFDAQTALTVATIFGDFYRDQERIVFYSCETADGRGAARARKFDGWFRQFNDESFIKADRTLFDPHLNLTYQNSLLLRADNPHRDEILAAFEALFGGLEAQK